MRHNAAQRLLGALLVALAACHEDGQLETPGRARARLSISATASSAGERVDVVLSYLRQPSVAVPLTSQTFDIVGTGDQQLAVPIDLTECLADAQRVAVQDDACSVIGVVMLRSAAGATLDSTSVGPLVVAVGGTTQASATLRAIGTVTVTTASPMFIGDANNAQVVIRDRVNAIITGRPVTWSSSNNGVASVSANGAVTAVSPGTATITATSQGVSGNANVTVENGMTIVTVSPASAALSVSIEAAVQVTFSENINASTVTPSSITLTQGSANVPVARSVNGAVVTLTPTAPLVEFNTSYAVGVTTALRSVAGNRLAANANATFTTVFWDPNYAYRLTNSARGANESLATASGANTPCFMGVTSSSTGQAWYFTPLASVPGFYGAQNMLGGANQGLEGADGTSPCLLLGPPYTLGLFSGTVWRPVAAGALAPGRYYLQNLNLGAAKSLDTPVDSTGPVPKMMPTANTPGQFWLFTRLFRM